MAEQKQTAAQLQAAQHREHEAQQVCTCVLQILLLPQPHRHARRCLPHAAVPANRCVKWHSKTPASSLHCSTARSTLPRCRTHPHSLARSMRCVAYNKLATMCGFIIVQHTIRATSCDIMQRPPGNGATPAAPAYSPAAHHHQRRCADRAPPPLSPRAHLMGPVSPARRWAEAPPRGDIAPPN